MRRLLLLPLTMFLFIPSVSAFSANSVLVDQIDSYESAVLQEDSVQLAANEVLISDLFINPNFPTWRDMYLSTDHGVYMNREEESNWFKHESLSALFPDGLIEVQFEGWYVSSLEMLAYSKDKVYISYNNGESWGDVTPDTDEDILYADFGPDFGDNNQLYFITESGLYRKSLSSGSIMLLVESIEPGSVHNFRYVPTQSRDNLFYVVNGNTLLKTENYGDSWLTEDFGSSIVDFEIKQKTYENGDLILLTADSELHYATSGMDFYTLDLPAEINSVYVADYIILTDQGFYGTYTDGEKWAKLDYDPMYIDAISDYDFAYDGSLQNLFVVNNGRLYKDYDLTETFEEYMGGLDTNLGYASTGEVVSRDLIELMDENYAEAYVVNEAMLTADGDLNGQSIDFYMTADGVNWEAVTPNVNHTFENQGRDLRWKAVLSTEDPAVTPVLRSVNVDFGLEESLGCAGFSDIAFDDPDCAAVEYVKDQGIFEGYPDGSFGPNIAINRAETVKVITEGFDYTIEANNNGDLGFSDVELDSWYMNYLNTAKNAGIIEGYPDGTFRPADTVIYAEMMKIFLETADVVVGELVDGDEWYQGYVDYASENDLVMYENVSEGMKRLDVAKLFYQWAL
ncbi:S-layer homology domain-containing protein [Patescibacteria group bacterium]|nr:S-layer homology domain-containing protein [Patescibacteria group bacterium]